MGASCWIVWVPWAGDLASALAEARQRAWSEVPAEERAAAEAVSEARLLGALDLDSEDEDLRQEWLDWLRAADPAARYVVARGPGLTGSVLDVDHVEHEPIPSGDPAPGALLMLVQPPPGLLGVRWPTEAERAAWFDGPPTEQDVESVLDGLTRDDVVAIVVPGEDGTERLAILGVTGD